SRPPPGLAVAMVRDVEHFCAAVTGAFLLDLFRRDLAGNHEAYEADDDHGDTIAMQKEVPGLAERDDAEDHQSLHCWMQPALVEGAEAHLRIAPKLMPRRRWLRRRKVK